MTTSRRARPPWSHASALPPPPRLSPLCRRATDDLASSWQVIAATNRVDILDPALLRSGRIDRKVEFKLPTEEACARIMQIHSRKMNCSPDVNYEELGRCCDDFNGAQLKAVCVEAGMLALRREGTEIGHEDFMEGITQVQAKKKASLAYYA
jgi:26S proteasome regulatory subunit T5